MSLNIQREAYTEAPAWLASHRGAMYKTGGITLSRAAKTPNLATGKRIYRSGEFVGLLNPTASKLWGSYGDGVKATLVTALLGADNDIQWTARTAGAGGNLITIAYVDPNANSQALSVVVVGTAITVNLATGAAGAITSTAKDVLAAVMANADAAVLVLGELAIDNNGHGVVTAMAAANLAGGVSPVATTATLTTGDIDAVVDTSITYTARNPGAEGNNIQISYVVPVGAAEPLSINVAGAGTTANPYVITVNLATAAAGVAKSTAAEIAAAVNSHHLTAPLVSAVCAGVAGAGVPLIAFAAAPLVGGAGPNVSMAEGEFGILTHDVDVTDGDGIGGVLFGGKVITARMPRQPDVAVRAALPHVLFTVENAP